MKTEPQNTAQSHLIVKKNGQEDEKVPGDNWSLLTSPGWWNMIPFFGGKGWEDWCGSKC